MSAFRGKADIIRYGLKGPLIAISGHSGNYAAIFGPSTGRPLIFGRRRS